MTPKIFASTSCLWSEDLDEGVPALFDAGFDGVELSASPWFHNVRDKIRRWHDYGPLSIHNYFPRPQSDFVFNLSSQSTEILVRSRQHAETAISVAHSEGMEWVSFHSGFLLDPRPEELGAPLTAVPLTNYQIALDSFLEQAQELSNFAEARGVRVLWENNVLSPHNYQTFETIPLLAVTPDQIMTLNRELPRSSGILLDVAHLSVSCNALGLDKRAALRELSETYIGLHLSEDSGLIDDGALLEESSWFWRELKRPSDYVVVESHFADSTVAAEQARMVKRLLRDGASEARQEITASNGGHSV